jgi:mycolipenoyl-CoA---2-(long-chain-fatty acyl)-trehalose mycolipenoyltransferase / long-chain-acyl-CoA---trehalose acyltransferase
VTAFGTLDDWAPGPGSVVSWHASLPSCSTALRATRNGVPASFQQDQHLRAFRRSKAGDTRMSRLCIGTWRVPGICDVPTMTAAINRHLRRHDTYRSWFSFNDSDEIVRRVIADPDDIEYLPVNFGVMSSPEIRDHLLETTPPPLEWNCFSFGIVQSEDHFTFYGSFDHLHTDAMSTGIVFLEVQMTYNAMLEGDTLPLPEPGSYNDYCVREREHTSALTFDSPQIREWIRFAGHNDGTLPGFPLPLGEPSHSAMVVVPLMDEGQADRFEAACQAAGARFSGGVFACAARAELELTGRETYCGLTPHNTRTTPAENLTAGWFASLIPITVAVEDKMPFGAVAQAAQIAFDHAKQLANVPFYRVLELVPRELMRLPQRAAPMLSFIDIRKIPLSVKWDDLNVGIFGDSGLADQVYIWVNRFEKETTLTLSFPDNPIARESVARYAETVQSVYARAAATVLVGDAYWSPVPAIG